LCIDASAGFGGGRPSSASDVAAYTKDKADKRDRAANYGSTSVSPPDGKRAGTWQRDPAMSQHPMPTIGGALRDR